MLSFVLAPDPIYKTRCQPVAAVTDAVRATLEEMMEMLRGEHAIGIAAPMVGLSQQLVVIEMEHEGKLVSLKMVNPTITDRSAQQEVGIESSITFLGVSMPVPRATAVTVAYLDETGTTQTLQATGLLARCLQHEIDYLNGVTILHYQSALKRDMLTRKLEKEKRHFKPHVHGAHCNH